MEREHRHRRVDAVVAQRQIVRARADRRRALRRALGGHDVARLDRDDVAVARLVGARARADVHDAARVAERRLEPPGDPRVLAPRGRVALPDRLVAVASRPGPVTRLAPSGVSTKTCQA